MLDRRTEYLGKVNLVIQCILKTGCLFLKVIDLFCYLIRRGKYVETHSRKCFWSGHLPSMRLRGCVVSSHLNVPLAVRLCMSSQWMVTGSNTGSTMHMGMYFILFLCTSKLSLSCFSFCIKLKTEKGYFDGTFIMKDNDVSSFVEYVYEKTKHVNNP